MKLTTSGERGQESRRWANVAERYVAPALALLTAIITLLAEILRH